MTEYSDKATELISSLRELDPINRIRVLLLFLEEMAAMKHHIYRIVCDTCTEQSVAAHNDCALAVSLLSTNIIDTFKDTEGG